MRGADGWSIQELSWLSDEFTSLLLLIFQEAERLRIWPEQLTTWVLVLLRKGDDPCPGWSMIRPITVASVCYRIWSCVRTGQLMSHARSILSLRRFRLVNRWQALSLTSPSASISLTGTCMLKALMIRFGFPLQIVEAWTAMLFSIVADSPGGWMCVRQCRSSHGYS